MTKEQIKKIEEIASDTLAEYLQEKPVEDRFNDPNLIINFGHAMGQYLAVQTLCWMPFEIWRQTHKEGFKKYSQIAKDLNITIPQAILSDVLDRTFKAIYDAIDSFSSKK